MSLRPDKKSGRSRSKSPGPSRERSRSHTREPQYAEVAPQYYMQQPSPGQPYATTVGDPITMGNYADLPPEQRPGYTRTAVPTAQGVSYAQPGNVQYAQTQQQYSYSTAPAAANAPTRSPNVQYSTTPSNITYTTKPVVDTSQPSVRRSAQPMSPAYPSPGGQVQYTAMPRAPPQPPAAQPVYSPQPMGPPSPSSEHQRALSISTSSRDGRKVVEMVPGGGGGGGGFAAPPSPGGHRPSLSVGGGGGGHRPERLRMDRLSVSGGRPDLQTFSPGGGSPSGGLPPPSPLLEAYHGTYQSISPLPSAMMFDDNLDHLPPLDAMSPRDMGHGRHHQSFSDRRQSFSDRSPSPPSRSKGKDRLALAAYGGGRFDEPPKKEKRRVKIYDATDDALALVEAMGAKPVNADTLIDILPALSHDQILELRIEFKRHCKLQGRGINIAKYIKLKTSGNFGKIAHVTALGRYESEGFWANYWYQSHTSQRELLIEALMGRQNHEIREIKDAFKDKRYGDSLVKCMDKELKADKFRKAILMALEGERQEESDVWEIEYRNRDVETLYRALNAREGGESAMLSIVVMRSDAHMREILRTYERRFQGNFARDALKKSNNLVGEVIAHILNGVINRPARDAMLLHHALMDLIEPSHEPPRSSSKKSSSSSSGKHERQQRYELLISRLVRLHWERMHLVRVKAEYEDKYGRVVEEDIEEATKGDFREFCIALCQTGR